MYQPAELLSLTCKHQNQFQRHRAQDSFQAHPCRGPPVLRQSNGPGADLAELVEALLASMLQTASDQTALNQALLDHAASGIFSAGSGMPGANLSELDETAIAMLILQLLNKQTVAKPVFRNAAPRVGLVGDTPGSIAPRSSRKLLLMRSSSASSLPVAIVALAKSLSDPKVVRVAQLLNLNLRDPATLSRLLAETKRYWLTSAQVSLSQGKLLETNNTVRNPGGLP